MHLNHPSTNKWDYSYNVFEELSHLKITLRDSIYNVDCILASKDFTRKPD